MLEMKRWVTVLPLMNCSTRKLISLCKRSSEETINFKAPSSTPGIVAKKKGTSSSNQERETKLKKKKREEVG